MRPKVLKCVLCDKYMTDDPHIHRFPKRKPKPKRPACYGPGQRRSFKINLDVIEDNPARYGH